MDVSTLNECQRRNYLMAVSGAATPRPWRRRVLAGASTDTPYNQTITVQDKASGAFTAEDAEFIVAAAANLENLVKESLRRENEVRRLSRIVWDFLSLDPPEERKESAQRLYEEAENAMMDLGYYNREMVDA